MNLLVAGAQRVDAGKTTFAVGLVRRLDAVGFKPRAGNDYWFDHGDYRRAVEAGRLYGKDAKRLAAASAAEVAPEAINPVHRLWRPDPGPGTGLLGRERRTFVVDRAGDRYVVNGAAEVPPAAREHLPLADAPRVASLDAFDDLMERWHLPAIRSLVPEVEAARHAVVESYGDVAVPLREVAYDAVAVVEPGRVRAYDGDRYLKAREVVRGSPREGRLEAKVEDVVEPIDPVATTPLPPLSDGEREDPRTAYADAYDAVLAVARE